MGSRKHKMAEAIKEAKKTRYSARLNNVPTSPRKMRLVADMVRGMDAFKAMSVLQFTPKEAAGKLSKLLSSAIASYEQKSGGRADEGELFIKEVYVDSARMLKRLRPAPQGRAHRIRKRSNHVTLVLGVKGAEESPEVVNNETTK